MIALGFGLARRPLPLAFFLLAPMSRPDACSHNKALVDDETPAPRTGWQRLLWLLIWLIGAVSAAGLVMMVYLLAREIMSL